MTVGPKVVSDRGVHRRLVVDDVSNTVEQLSHELRTPLGAAMTFAEILRDEHFGPLGNARYRQYAADIYDGLRHALTIIDRMSAGSATSLPDVSRAHDRVDLGVVIPLALTLVRGSAERGGIGLDQRIELGLPLIRAHHGAVTQILLNLLGNAVKFTAPGGLITIEARRWRDGSIDIVVTDTGDGIAADDLAWIRSGLARPLHRTALDSRSGLGLGLLLSQELAQANGARLSFDSTVGVGTRAALIFAGDRVALPDVGPDVGAA